MRNHNLLNKLAGSLLLFSLAVLVFMASVAPAQAVAGPNYAGAVGTNSFTLPANAVGADEITCAGDNYGTTIVSGFWNTFGFAIPTNATINGIQVEVKWSDNADPGLAGDHGVVVGKNEATIGVEKTPLAPPALGVPCGAAQTLTSFGGATDLWGLTWTPAEINAADFTVRIRKSILGAEHGLYINWIRVTVDYTTPTWESYNDSAHNYVNNNFIAGQQTVYMLGTGFGANYSYKVAYYDGGNTKRSTDASINANSSGNLSSSYTFASGTDVAGLWHAQVFNASISPPVTYDAANTSVIADHSFSVDITAIPEFPAGIVLPFAASLILYTFMRKKYAKK